MVDTAICLSHMSAIIVAGELLPTSVETQVTRQGSASCRLQATQFPINPPVVSRSHDSNTIIPMDMTGPIGKSNICAIRWYETSPWVEFRPSIVPMFGTPKDPTHWKSVGMQKRHAVRGGQRWTWGGTSACRTDTDPSQANCSDAFQTFKFTVDSSLVIQFAAYDSGVLCETWSVPRLLTIRGGGR
ncbi:hypothetical protein BC629DRAFT_1435674 [Irpex lacteus]|nr:hypothetical protein BC629DRAFT_1435674 [Irpex lacteus]